MCVCVRACPLADRAEGLRKRQPWRLRSAQRRGKTSPSPAIYSTTRWAPRWAAPSPTRADLTRHLSASLSLDLSRFSSIPSHILSRSFSLCSFLFFSPVSFPLARCCRMTVTAMMKARTCSGTLRYGRFSTLYRRSLHHHQPPTTNHQPPPPLPPSKTTAGLVPLRL